MPTEEHVQNVSVQNEHFHQEPKQAELEKHEGTKKKQIRCKKWPQCKADNCEFAHPSETVKIYFNILKVPIFPQMCV